MTKNLSLFDTSLDKVVDCLHERYKCFLAPKIYTNFGSILVAVNPIYLTSDEYSSIYGQSGLSNADAHIYTVAKRAIDMVRPSSQETVVVIGDSGSGKTVTVGHMLDYLTASTRSSKCEVFYRKILSASHLMELFANAQTCLNMNSSRFGKLISLVYSCGGVPHLEGAEVEAFLLEKSRVTSTPEPDGCGENFHMLRLLVSKLDDPAMFLQVFGFQKQELLSGEFSFRVAPYCPNLDEKWFSFERACHLLSTFDFDSEVQLDLFKTLSVILHLCNLEFTSRDESSLGCEIAQQLPNVQTSLSVLQSLLGITDWRDLVQALSSKPVSAMSSRRQSVYRKPCGLAETEGRRNSLSRFLYSQLFEFVMTRVCSSVAPSTTDAANTSKVSVLDIFGFENFTKSRNDFEQLCINFCNEKIQQHFARICINDVRRELTLEGLSQSATESSYSDNESVISLFELSPTGIFCVLEEKCRLNRTATGSPFSSKIPTSTGRLTKAISVSSSSPSSQSSEDFYQTMCFNFRGSANKSIKLSRPGNNCQFTIFHYAGPVVYSCENFVEKSRDDVSPDLIAFFSLSIKNQFVSSLVNLKQKTEGACTVSKATGPLTPQSTNENGTVTVRKRSLPAKYRSATTSLVTFLNNSSNVHYVRCIRPNGKPVSADRAVADRSFDRDYVSTQLANAGLVDVLRLASATGKLSRRFSYRAFTNGFSSIFRTFGIKHSSYIDEFDNKENSRKSNVIPDGLLERNVCCLFNLLAIPAENDDFFFGKTKLFLSDKLLAFFRRLQQVISRRAVYHLQTYFRKYLVEKRRRIERERVEKERQEMLRKQQQQEVLKKEQEMLKKQHVVVEPPPIMLVEPEISPLKLEPAKIDFEDSPPVYSSLYIPKTFFFCSGDIISRRRHFLQTGQAGFWFHTRPNPLLHGAHVVNAKLLFQHASLTDCLD